MPKFMPEEGIESFLEPKPLDLGGAKALDEVPPDLLPPPELRLLLLLLADIMRSTSFSSRLSSSEVNICISSTSIVTC